MPLNVPSWRNNPKNNLKPRSVQSVERKQQIHPLTLIQNRKSRKEDALLWGHRTKRRILIYPSRKLATINLLSRSINTIFLLQKLTSLFLRITLLLLPKGRSSTPTQFTCSILSFSTVKTIKRWGTSNAVLGSWLTSNWDKKATNGSTKEDIMKPLSSTKEQLLYSSGYSITSLSIKVRFHPSMWAVPFSRASISFQKVVLKLTSSLNKKR